MLTTVCARCQVDFDIVVDVPLCGEVGALGRPCTRPDDHHGGHEAWRGGRLVEAWPREDPV